MAQEISKNVENIVTYGSFLAVTVVAFTTIPVLSAAGAAGFIGAGIIGGAVSTFAGGVYSALGGIGAAIGRKISSAQNKEEGAEVGRTVVGLATSIAIAIPMYGVTKDIVINGFEDSSYVQQRQNKVSTIQPAQEAFAKFANLRTQVNDNDFTPKLKPMVKAPSLLG